MVTDKQIVMDNLRFLSWLVESSYKTPVTQIRPTKGLIEFYIGKTKEESSKVILTESDAVERIKTLCALASDLYETEVKRFYVEGNRVVIPTFPRIVIPKEKFEKDLRRLSTIRIEQMYTRHGIPYKGVEKLQGGSIYELSGILAEREKCINKYGPGGEMYGAVPVEFCITRNGRGMLCADIREVYSPERRPEKFHI